jgi:hypothetical protein
MIDLDAWLLSTTYVAPSGTIANIAVPKLAAVDVCTTVTPPITIVFVPAVVDCTWTLTAMGLPVEFV